MPRTKISEFSATPANNTDIDSINIAEGCAPSGINDAIRELMAQLKDFQTGAVGDSFNGPVGTTTAAAGAFTTLAASGAVTLSGGTANGVAYLNGSKVVTSGSALTFNGTDLKVNSLLSTSNLVVSVDNASNSMFVGGGSFSPSELNLESVSSTNWKVGGTERMRLTSTGLGIGTSSPAHKLDVATASGDCVIRLGNGTSQARFAIDSDGPYIYALTSGDNALRVFTPAGSQAMTLDASGQLAVGITSPLSRLHVGGADTVIRLSDTNGGTCFWGDDATGVYWRSFTADTFRWVRANGNETARMDSSGNLLVGCTALGATGGFGVGPNSGSSFIDICHVTGTASGTAYARFFFNSSQIGSITQSGTTAVLYNLTSDQRLKENIQDAESSSNLIDSIQVRKFDWKTDQTHQRYGFIAQELVTVYPEAVHQPADSEEMMAVDYSKLVPMLVKEIQSLRVRVAQLESN